MRRSAQLMARLVARLFPRAFRREFEDDMLATFEDRWRECGGWRLALRTIGDAIGAAVLLRWERRRGPARKGDGAMTVLWRDLQFAIRVMSRSPGFAAVVVLVLAIGIGANSAIFSLVDAALLRPLPYSDPEALRVLWESPPGYAHNRVSPLNFLDWSEQNKMFTSMAAVSGGSRTLMTAQGAERIPGQAVTARFFDVLGIRPLAGRTFQQSDAGPDSRVVVVSERFWRNRFGSDPKLVGGAIRLDGLPFTVIGVVPAGFQIFAEADLWTPYVVNRSPEQRAMHYLLVLGRLKLGVNNAQARGDMDAIAAHIARISPATNKGWTVTIEPMREVIADRNLRATSLVLAGVAGFVLLMACANVANLLLARGAGRAREIAVRASLGGSQWRILRQLLTESSLLAGLGGIAGIALAWIILAYSPSFLPPGLLPVSLRVGMDPRVVAFAAALTIATALLFGLAPAWQASRTPLAGSLSAGGRSLTGGSSALRGLLAVGEIAVAVLLTTGAGLLARTLESLNSVDPGFHATNLLTMRVTLPLSRYPTPSDALRFYQTLEREMRALPGVRQFAFGGTLPTDGWDIGQSFRIPGRGPVRETAEEEAANYQIVSGSYFETLGIPLLAGRPFNERDVAESVPVCIVNQELVRRYFNGQNPVGARVEVEALTPAGPRPVLREIVGVIKQVKVQGLAEKEKSLEIYVPVTQNAWFSASMIIKAEGDALSQVRAVKAAVARVDPEQPLSRIRTMEEVASQSIVQPRFRASLVGAFAILAVTLACVGVFGVLAFSVGQRTREFGIRMALGASAGDVLRLVLTGGAKIVAAGLAIGLGAALLLAKSLQSLLFGVKPIDPPAFVLAGGLLLCVALLACAIPAARAASVDPSVALRQD